MLRVIAVDDESSALKWFHRIASENHKIALAGEFQYADEAIEFVKEQQVDVAFLDIEMPEMNGLDLAEQLMEIDPYINVIFITAYNQYALDAFRAHAIGYLLKPLDSEEFAEQIDLLTCRYAKRPKRNYNQRLFVRCFGQFTVSAQAEGMSAIRWKTAKAEELFALLIHHQGKVKSKGSLIEMLWPDIDPKKSANLFRVTCTYIRSALAEMGFFNLLLRELDGYKLNTDLIDCDLFSFRFLARSISSQRTDKLEEAFVLYSGEYLEGKIYDWALGARTQLESDFKNLQYYLADRCAANNSYEKACKALERILQLDPYDEEAVARLIKMRLHAGDNAAAAKVYRKYESVVKEELGVLPSNKLKELLV